MTRIVDFIFLIFAAFLGKKALLLSVFAFAPSVLANDIPLATLSVDNIQVRAEWNMVGDSANHFSVEGGTLMLTADIEAGDTFIATVEVRDKFSTLNPNYEDLKVTVMITAVIISEYLNANVPLISVAVTVAYGVLAVEGRAVTVGTAFPSADGNQVFYVNLSLGNILNELYPPKVIIDDGKAFKIDGKYPIGNSYVYFANLTVGSDSVDKQHPHEVIVVGVNDCPRIYEVIAWKEDVLRISESDTDKVRKYMLINGTIYTDISPSYIGISNIKEGVESYVLGVSGDLFFGGSFDEGDYPIKFADHFLCGTE